MALLRTFLISGLLVISAYTMIVISNHGMTLLQVFFADMARLGWPGQFNLDFFFMLLLSGLWTAWRNQFSAAGLALGLVAVFGGFPFLSIYLLVLSWQCGGDIRQMLLGPARAGAGNT